MGKVTGGETGGPRHFLAIEIFGQVLLHELKGARQLDRVGMPGAGLDGVDELLQHVTQPRRQRFLIGDAGQRRIWTLGVEYTHLLHQGQRFRLEFAQEIADGTVGSRARFEAMGTAEYTRYLMTTAHLNEDVAAALAKTIRDPRMRHAAVALWYTRRAEIDVGEGGYRGEAEGVNYFWGADQQRNPNLPDQPASMVA